MGLIGEEGAKFVYQAPSEFPGRHATSGANALLTLNIAAPKTVGQRNAFNYVHWSFDDTPNAAVTLTITDGVVTEIVYIIAGGPGELCFIGAAFAPNAQVSITMTGGGAGINSSLAIIGARQV